MLIKIKELVPINDTLANIYIDMAVAMIKTHLNNDRIDNVYILAHYDTAIISIVENLYARKGTSNIKSETQGKRSVTYQSNTDIMSSVASLLPKPFVRLS